MKEELNRKIMEQEARYDFLKEEVHCLNAEKIELQVRINKAIQKLKEHKQDLDYEPWSLYQIEGNILFDLVNILKGSNTNE